MLVTESLVQDLLGIIVALLVTVIAYYKWKFQYWKRKNVPFLEPKIPFGNIPNPITNQESFGISLNKIYKQMRKKKWRHGGIFLLSRPTYMVTDPEYVKNIMAKDFGYFVDRGFYYNEKNDPLSAHLFAIGGTKWKNLRAKLTPTFTSGKMKMMFHTIVKCEENLQKMMDKECDGKTPIDIKEILASFTTDVIGSCAFGLECDSFDNNSPFKVYGKRALVSSGVEAAKGLFANNFPDFSKKIALALIPKDVSQFYLKLVRDTVNYREKHNVTRKDFLQLLIDMKNKKFEEDHKHDGKSLTIEEIAAQSFVFFVAGFETSSTTMSFALYELSKHPEIQDRVRQEVKTVLQKHNNEITYEAVQEMKYMDQVLDETLRKYPPVSFLTRESIKPYKVPDQNLVIETGTTVVIPVMGLHYDEEYFPNPEKFDPERFTEVKKAEIRNRFVYLPFGEGPRMCIGLRFGVMQSKVGLASLLKAYKFSLNKKTKEPFSYRVDSFVLAVDGEIWLDAEKIC